VLDLGAGTGKLTRLLRPCGARVLALEPVEGMRAHLQALAPEAVLVDGVAEAIDLPDGSVDAVTAGTAFHWFDCERALPEIHRVLRKGGRLGLIANVRDESAAWVRQVSRIIKRGVVAGSSDAVVAHARRMSHRGAWRACFDGTELFSPLRQRSFAHIHETDVETQLARFESVSFISAMPTTARRRLLRELEVHFLTQAGPRGLVAFPYVATAYWCRALVSSSASRSSTAADTPVETPRKPASATTRARRSSAGSSERGKAASNGSSRSGGKRSKPRP
jgi:ubiquinone/menaquinone biosynthesis C-methylase UbiE